MRRRRILRKRFRTLEDVVRDEEAVDKMDSIFGGKGELVHNI